MRNFSDYTQIYKLKYLLITWSFQLSVILLEPRNFPHKKLTLLDPVSQKYEPKGEGGGQICPPEKLLMPLP